MISSNGGYFPNGIIPVVVVVQRIVFSYASIELLGTAAGETADARKVIPKAINTVIVRTVIFYVGYVLRLALLLPYAAYSSDQSLFVTFFGALNVDGADTIMNMVVLTAAMSSLNAGLYSTGRILHSMAIAGSAPAFAARLSAFGVPYGGIFLTAVVAMAGVGLNAVAPAQAFEIVLNFAAIGIISAWAVIIACQLRLWSMARAGTMQRPTCRMPGAPCTGIATIIFLGGVVVLMGLDKPVGTITVASLAVIAPLLIAGWFVSRSRIYGRTSRSADTQAF